MEAEVEHTALISVKVDLESGNVVSAGVRAVTDDDESAAEVNVTLEGETDQPDEVLDRATSRTPSRTTEGKPRSCRPQLILARTTERSSGARE